MSTLPCLTTPDGIVVREIGDPVEMRTEIDRESGSLLCWRDFTVQRPGRETHRVSVEIDEDGFPQNNECDCAGFRHRGECSHVSAVYACGILNNQEDET